MLHRVFLPTVIIACLKSVAGTSAEPAAPQLVVTPRANARVVSPSNRPFLASTRVLQPVNPDAAGCAV